MSTVSRSNQLNRGKLTVAERKSLAQSFPDRSPVQPVTRIRTIPTEEEELHPRPTRAAGPAPNELAQEPRSKTKKARLASSMTMTPVKKSKISRKETLDSWEGGTGDSDQESELQESLAPPSPPTKKIRKREVVEDEDPFLESLELESSIAPVKTTPNVTVTQHAPYMDVLNHESLLELQKFVRNYTWGNMQINRADYIAPIVSEDLDLLWPEDRKDTWEKATDEDFFHIMLHAFLAENEGAPRTPEDRLRLIPFDPPYQRVVLAAYCRKVRLALQGEPKEEQETKEREWVQILIRQMSVGGERLPKITRSIVSELEPKKAQILTIKDFFRRLYAIQLEYQNAVRIAVDKVGLTYPPSWAEKRPNPTEGKPSVSPLTKPKPAQSKPQQQPNKSSNTCLGCGRSGHTRPNCLLVKHPEFNQENIPWSESKKGKAWRQRKKGIMVLPATETLNNDPTWVPPKRGKSDWHILRNLQTPAEGTIPCLL